MESYIVYENLEKKVLNSNVLWEEGKHWEQGKCQSKETGILGLIESVMK